MEKGDKVTIRLTPEQCLALDSLVKEGEFKNRSQVLRSALDRMVQGSVEEDDVVRMKLPGNIIGTVNYLVRIGYYADREGAMRQLIRDSFFDLDLEGILNKDRSIREMGIKASADEIVEDEFREYMKK